MKDFCRNRSTICVLATLLFALLADRPASCQVAKARPVAGSVQPPKADGEIDAATLGKEGQAPPATKREDRGFSIVIDYGSSTHFNDLRSYSLFCGSMPAMVQLRADKRIVDWRIPVSLGFAGGYFSDSCKTFKSNGESAELIEVPDARTELKIIPLQFFARSMFDLPWLDFLAADVWAGMEKIYFEETRILSSLAAGGSASNGPESSKRLVVKGEQSGVAFGVAVNLLLNKLDEQSALGLYNSVGLGKVYLRLFAESGMQSGGDPNFSRLAVGFGFGFASGVP